ncbi:MAG: hypothetical protein ACO3RV_10520, partial [Luteolibacter sp.]
TEPVILSATVDRLALIKAEIARLKAEEDALKDVLIECGQDVIEGTAHRCAISHCAGRELIDWKTIAGKFNPSRQLIAAHTSTGEPYATVRLSARKA